MGRGVRRLWFNTFVLCLLFHSQSDAVVIHAVTAPDPTKPEECLHKNKEMISKNKGDPTQVNIITWETNPNEVIKSFVDIMANAIDQKGCIDSFSQFKTWLIKKFPKDEYQDAINTKGNIIKNNANELLKFYKQDDWRPPYMQAEEEKGGWNVNLANDENLQECGGKKKKAVLVMGPSGAGKTYSYTLRAVPLLKCKPKNPIVLDGGHAREKSKYYQELLKISQLTGKAFEGDEFHDKGKNKLFEKALEKKRNMVIVDTAASGCATMMKCFCALLGWANKLKKSGNYDMYILGIVADKPLIKFQAVQRAFTENKKYSAGGWPVATESIFKFWNKGWFAGIHVVTNNRATVAEEIKTCCKLKNTEQFENSAYVFWEDKNKNSQDVDVCSDTACSYVIEHDLQGDEHFATCEDDEAKRRGLVVKNVRGDNGVIYDCKKKNGAETNEQNEQTEQTAAQCGTIPSTTVRRVAA